MVQPWVGPSAREGVARPSLDGDGPPAARGAPSAPVLSLEGVTKRYPRGGGIEDVSLEVGPGEVFGFLGPNGAGKTTTIRLLVDLIRPDRGRIELFGLDARRAGVEAHRRIGYLPGDLSLYERLTARELLAHFAHLRRPQRRRRPWRPGTTGDLGAGTLAERLDLELDRPIGALSKGNRQKVGLVQALMGEPSLLVLDEPTTGLDPLVQHEVHELLRAAASAGRTVFLSSHALAEVDQVADRVGMIRAGRLEAVERIADLRARAAHIVELRTVGPFDRSAVEHVPGVVVREATARGARLEVVGSLDPIVRVLARCALEDLTVREPDLEEMFLRYYTGAADRDGLGVPERVASDAS